MTSYSFEPVSAPDADELDPLGPEDRRQVQEGAVPAEGVDPGSVEGEEEHLREFDPVQHAPRPPAQPGPATEPTLADQLEQARDEAHRRGVEEGRRAEAERLRTALEAVRAVVDEIHRADERREKEVTERIAALATAIAAHLLEREVRTSPDIVSDLVRRAIAEFPVAESLTAHLNPGDLTLLSSGIGGESARAQLTSGQSVRWIPDPEIRPGGCLVEGGDRVVDARLSTILERVFGVLTDG